MTVVGAHYVILFSWSRVIKTNMITVTSGRYRIIFADVIFYLCKHFIIFVDLWTEWCTIVDLSIELFFFWWKCYEIFGFCHISCFIDQNWKVVYNFGVCYIDIWSIYFCSCIQFGPFHPFPNNCQIVLDWHPSPSLHPLDHLYKYGG